MQPQPAEEPAEWVPSPEENSGQMIRRSALLLTLVLLLMACTRASQEQVETPVATLAQPRVSTSTPFEPQPDPTEVPPTETPVPLPTVEMPAEGYGPDNFPPNVNPLTGLPVNDTARLDRRPLAVKVTNFPRYTRPQWGLSLADIVIEYYQNGGISRHFAIFYGNEVERIGPIRSARFPDSELIRMYKTIFAYGSADFRVLNRFAASAFAPLTINEFPAGCGPMCRVDTDTYNHLVTNTEDLVDYIESINVSNGRQNLDGMLFKNGAPAGGESVDQIFVRYGRQVYSRWDYEPGTNRYLRYQDAVDDFGTGEDYEQLKDKLNERPITADNVVVLLVPHEYFSQNPEIIEIRFSGSGTAYAFRDGNAYEVRWNRPSPDSVLYLTNQDGSRFAFKPGQSWFQVLGQTSQISEPEAQALRFQFSIP